MSRLIPNTTSAHALLSLAIALLAPSYATARPSGFYLGGAYYRESPEPLARRRQTTPAPVAAIPMPVPRPHFPDDTKGAAMSGQEAATSAQPAEPIRAEPEVKAITEQPKTAEPTPPVSASSPGDAGPPLPPEKPADLQKPGEVQKPAGLQKPAERAAAAPAPKDAGSPSVSTVTSPDHPTVAPSGATNAFAPRAPDDPACPARLTARHVEAEPIAIDPQPDQRCTVVQAVRLDGLVLPDGGKVAFPDRPTIACTTADVFSLYVRDLLVPLAKGTFSSAIAAVWTGPGLECRSRDHIFGAKLSAHGQGLAIDIAQLKLADGRLIAVGEPKTDTDTAFETASRAAACGYFHTVLGPGSDSYHRTHWHFDLEVRGAKGDTKYCK